MTSDTIRYKHYVIHAFEHGPDGWRAEIRRADGSDLTLPDRRQLASNSTSVDSSTAELARLEIRRAEDIAPAFGTLKGSADALHVCTGPVTNSNRTLITTLANGARLPTIHGSRLYVRAGGLVSYGADIPDMFRRAADYVDKILHGAKPGDLPVQQPSNGASDGGTGQSRGKARRPASIAAPPQSG